MGSSSENDSPRRNWKQQEAPFTRKVRENTENKVLMDPRILIQNLGLDNSLTTESMGMIIKRQYWLAISKDDWTWVFQIQREAAIFFGQDWIVANLPHRDKNKNLRKNNI